MKNFALPLGLMLSLCLACGGPEPTFVSTSSTGGSGGSTSSAGNGPGGSGASGGSDCNPADCPGADNATASCDAQGQCTLACDPGYDDCDGDLPGTGCETDVSADPANCGSCGTTCPLGCSESACITPVKMAATQGSACGLLSDGRLYCWGANEWGEVGDGSQTQHNLPYRVQLPEPAVDVALHNLGFDDHALGCAVLESGLVYCWGSGGLNGNPTQNGIAVAPSPVTSLSNARAVTVGGSHACAVRNDDSLYCWGDNDEGQVGAGTQSFVSTPVEVFDNVRQASAGYLHTCAVRNNGTLFCWGSGSFGQLGQGGNCPGGPTQLTPSLVPGLSNVEHVYAGLQNTCALVGTDAMCWGWDYNGGIGVQCSGCSATPILLSIGQPSFVMSGGDEAGYAIAGPDNTLFRWGGAPVPNDVSVPFCSVGNTMSTGWDQISLGYGLSCGIQNGIAVCLGDDSNGGVGDGPNNTSPKLTPTPVPFPMP